jgi:aspartate/methionine/tyrosine aminotransferase
MKKEILNTLKTFSKHYHDIFPLTAAGLSLKKRNKLAQDAWFASVAMKVGHKFHFLNRNDIQADTGANAYMPPESVDAIVSDLELEDFSGYHYYAPSQALASNIQRIYQHLGYLPDDYKIDVQLDANMSGSRKTPFTMTYGLGTTQIFDATLASLIQNKRDVILVPTPTYGLFIPLIEKHAKIKTIPYQPGGEDAYLTILEEAVKQAELENLEYYKALVSIKKAQLPSAKKNKDINKCKQIMSDLSKLLSDEDKPISEVQLECDTAVEQYNALIKLLKKDGIINKAMKSQLQLELLPRVRAMYSMNPMTPSGKVQTQAEIDALALVLMKFPAVTVIEDVIHRGISLDFSKEMGTYTKTTLVDRTLVLDGLSKIFDLARARAAFLIGHQSFILPIAHKLHETNCTMNGATSAFLEGIYALPNDKFKAHLIDLSQSYQARFNIVKAMVYGIDSFPKPERRKFVNQFYAENATIAGKHRKGLFVGIPDLTFYMQPEAGYFVLLDFSAYVGMYLGDIKMNTGMDFRNALFCLADVNTIPDILCFDDPGEGKAYLRFSLSIDNEIDMVEALLRIKALLSYCSDKPLFHKLEDKGKAEPEPEAEAVLALSSSLRKAIERLDRELPIEQKELSRPIEILGARKRGMAQNNTTNKRQCNESNAISTVECSKVRKSIRFRQRPGRYRTPFD